MHTEIKTIVNIFYHGVKSKMLTLKVFGFICVCILLRYEFVNMKKNSMITYLQFVDMEDLYIDKAIQKHRQSKFEPLVIVRHFIYYLRFSTNQIITVEVP